MSATPNRVAESIFGAITWIDEVTGFLPCPGKDLHSNASTKRDCRIKLNGAPTVFCVHNSCAGVVAEKNRLLRSEIGKSERGHGGKVQKWKPTAEDVQRAKDRESDSKLKVRAEKTLPQIIAANSCQPVDFWERSPFRLENDGAADWRLLLQLYKPSDVLWIGALTDSAKADDSESKKTKAAAHFRTVKEWLNATVAPGQHICPNPFAPGVCSRSAENIRATRFLIVESDAMPKNDFCAVLRWLEQFMWLRAVVDTAGKSLHGWFEYPEPAVLKDLKVILPAISCDKALFQPAHTCRLPGAMRDGKRQHLVYLDLEGAQ